MKKRNISSIIIEIVPIFALVALAILYVVLSGGNIRAAVLKNLINQTAITAIVSTGAVFIYTTGAFDISLGASTALSAILGAMAYNETNSLALMFVVAVGIGVIVSLVNSCLAAFLNLPVFVTTIAMLSVLNAMNQVIILGTGGESIKLPRGATKALDTTLWRFLILGVFIAICVLIFNYTALGRKEKFLGGNPVCAKLTGISVKLLSIVAFAIAGVGVGLAGFLTVVRAPTVTRTTASSIGMDVIIAIVFGGMPASGGSRSKIFAALIGTVSMVLLGQIMVLFRFSTGVTQLVKAILFLCVVTVAGLKGRKQLLTR